MPNLTFALALSRDSSSSSRSRRRDIIPCEPRLLSNQTALVMDMSWTKSFILHLKDDCFVHILRWLDVRSICQLDVAVSNVEERSCWLRSLAAIDNKSIDEYEHYSASIRWLVKREVGIATLITWNRTILSNPFAGLEVQSTEAIGPDDSNSNLIGRGSPTERRITLNRCVSVDISRSFVRCSTSVLSGIANLCPQLTSFTCQSSYVATDACLLALAKCCPQLNVINLCNRVIKPKYDIRCQMLIERFRDPEKPNRLWTRQITDSAISALAKGCCQLKTINLGITSITDIGVQAIALYCHQLTAIDLYWCKAITDIGIIALAKGCPDLACINIQKCCDVTQIGRSALAQYCPLLRAYESGDVPTPSCSEYDEGDEYDEDLDFDDHDDYDSRSELNSDDEIDNGNSLLSSLPFPTFLNWPRADEI